MKRGFHPSFCWKETTWYSQLWEFVSTVVPAVSFGRADLGLDGFEGAGVLRAGDLGLVSVFEVCSLVLSGADIGWPPRISPKISGVPFRSLICQNPFRQFTIVLRSV